MTWTGTEADGVETVVVNIARLSAKAEAAAKTWVEMLRIEVIFQFPCKSWCGAPVWRTMSKQKHKACQN